MQNATTYHPKDSSLKSRVEATLTVQKDFEAAQWAMKNHAENGFDSVIGTADEISFALNVSQNSLIQALNTLTLTDLENAKAAEILSLDQFQKLMLHKNRLKLQSTLSNQQYRNIQQSKGQDR